MSLLICLGALAFLMFVAYRGFSVILFAPVAAMAAVLLTDPSAVPVVFSGLFMDKLVGFVKLYFPVFLLGAVFGKVIEMSGFSRAIVSAIIRILGPGQAVLAVVLVGAVLTYGGVSLFVVVFAVYPFGAELFRQVGIPKRLLPAAVALGAFGFTMDTLPGTPQIQNIIPTTFFHTTAYAAPILGLVGTAFMLGVGIAYLDFRRRQALKAGEGYGTGHTNEPKIDKDQPLANPVIAILPLVVVGIANLLLNRFIPGWFGPEASATLNPAQPALTMATNSVAPIWAVMGALLLGILTVFLFAFRTLAAQFAEGSKQAVGGALLASLNTATEYGFGAVIAALPGFMLISHALASIPNPLINEAISVTTLAGITGSASGGLSIALAAMADQFIAQANAAGIPMEVLHRVAAMASGGMDTLPHNGAVITLLAVCGLSHRQSYGDIFAITLVKTSAVFFVIGFYYLTGLY
ncbi:transporter [Azorhizobium oxalatiphilum]|uniref:Transporter n=1 Tax=Azorhizobium oxalatiphilum TaxID=980631 RepID=A0A917FBH1_9HYPH|nr:GntP family permease [Azorhizobium oxalatiphilum]GGF63276.1 transporter [Azorhizobium oxalatiphilum]